MLPCYVAYLVGKAAVVLQNVVLLAAKSKGNLLCRGQEIGHLGIRELVQELSVVYVWGVLFGCRVKHVSQKVIILSLAANVKAARERARERKFPSEHVLYLLTLGDDNLEVVQGGGAGRGMKYGVASVLCSREKCA